MKKYLLIALIGFAAACNSSKHTTTSSSQNGSSYETAIVIQETHETPGVRAEYKWIADHYPGYKTKMQALQNKNKKSYDVLTIETSDGVEKVIYFDISNFFGKF